MSENKNQHFVPQFLLRNFSNDGKSVCAYVHKTKKHISNCSISRQCSKSFYYGKDLFLEKNLQLLESQFSSNFRNFEQNKNLGLQESNYLHQLFIATQMSRTEKMNLFGKGMIENFTQELKKMNIPNEISSMHAIDGLEEEIQNISARNLGVGLKCLPYLNDLIIQKLTNSTSIKFILSDNPVILSNPKFNSSRGSVGIGMTGIQILCPISPNTCIFLYDPAIYAPLATGEKFETIIKEPRIIDNINMATIHNSNNSIYYSNETSCEYLNDLHEEVPLWEPPFEHFNIALESGNIIGSIPYRVPVKYCRGYYLEKNTKLIAPVIRNPKLHMSLRAFSAAVRNHDYLPSQFDEFLEYESNESVWMYYNDYESSRELKL